MPWFERLHNNGKPTGEAPKFFTDKEGVQLERMKSAKWRRCEDEKPLKSRAIPEPTKAQVKKEIETTDTWVLRVKELGLPAYKKELNTATKEQLEALLVGEKRKSALEAIELALTAINTNKK